MNQSKQHLYVGMGCFWGVERIYWQLPGVSNTTAGYSGSTSVNPSYEQVCTGATGHAEVVKVEYPEDDPHLLATIFKAFWENHDPTQMNRQGNDVGTQYRSVIYYTTEQQKELAQKTRDLMAAELKRQGIPHPIVTSIEPAGVFYEAEEYHQRYLEKNPNGYCNHGPNGCSINVENLSSTTLVADAIVLPGLLHDR